MAHFVRVAVGITTAVAGVFGSTQALAEPLGAEGERAGYIVELTAPALALEAPRPAGGRLSAARWSPAEVAAHEVGVGALERNALAVATVAPAQVFHRYRSALSGFAAHLTSREAARLAGTPGVARVSRDVVRSISALRPLAAAGPAAAGQAAQSPAAPRSRVGGDGAAYLGLPDGLWRELGGPDRAGEDLVVGVIDTGINPDHPSFADRPERGGRRSYIGSPFGSPPAGWRGTCQRGEGFSGSDCNRKLIGARFFVSGFGADNVHPDDFLSPRDGSGHGSHTASTAAGNYGVDPVVGGQDLGVDLVSGIAPRARVAAYKVCWTGRAEPGRQASDGCADADSVAAVDAAVSDGVDVINFSVGGPTPELLGPVGRAFLGATSAGVFVANSAGNEGPEPATLGAPASVPWITSVAASTLARTFVGKATVRPAPGAEPLSVEGASVTAALGETPLVDAAAVGAGGISPEESELCLPGSLDPAKVSGKVVLCRRGQNARVEKGLVVKEAGGLGMLLYNPQEAQETVADGHVIPAVHLRASDGEAIKALIASSPGPVVALGAGAAVEDPSSGDVLAAFSSRGPQIAVPDIPKPDVTAPGVNILAATTPTPAGEGELPGESFALLSGTSMSSPHVAGAAALLLDRHPGWSPSAVKSALMLTADPDVRREDGVTPAGPFETGSGRIDPTAAAAAGLVLEATGKEYLGYLEGQDPGGTPGSTPPVAPIDLNLAAVSSSQMAGLVSTRRSFTGTDDSARSWAVRIEGLPGIAAQVSPKEFSVAAGETQELSLGFAVLGSNFDQYSTGAVVLRRDKDGQQLRLPVTLRPVRVAAPRLVAVDPPQSEGMVTIPLRAGFTGRVTATGRGLAAGLVRSGLTVGRQRVEPAPDPSVGAILDLTVPEGAAFLAGATSNVDGGDRKTDLDLYLYRDEAGDGFAPEDLVARSARGSAEEAIQIVAPPAGAYRFSVVGFTTRDPVSVFDFTTWVIDDPTADDQSPAPGFAVGGDPVDVVAGEGFSLEASWSGLADGVTGYGVITYQDASDATAAPVATTLVMIGPGPSQVGASPGARGVRPVQGLRSWRWAGSSSSW